ncbi:MAG: penicillin acylase family protein [Gammaproteobacteria bacterium]
MPPTMSLPISSLAKPWPLFGLALALFVLASAGGAWLYWRLTGGLAQLDGAANLHGLTAPVTIERDALGVPTLRAANRLDIARAIGFVHGQERFFQMDLLRRSAAGELAELFGAAALPKDKELRIHRFRWRAERALGLLAPAERDQIDAYAAGVNAGLAALRAPPFEYLLLRAHPVPWRATDSALVIYAMYLDLQDSTGQIDTFYGLLHDFLPEPLYAFLTPAGGEWDAPWSAILMSSLLPTPIPSMKALANRTANEKSAADPTTVPLGWRRMDGIGSNN